MCASYEKKRGFVGCEILDKYYNLSVERFKELTIKNREFIYA
jgi:DNA modification methylase